MSDGPVDTAAAGDNAHPSHARKSSVRTSLPDRNTLHVNPFVHRLSFSKLETIRNTIVTYTLFPFKAFLAVTSLLAAGFLAYLSLLGHTDEDAKRPLAAWRNWLRPLVVLFSRGLFFFGGFNWVSVKGERVSSKVAPILVMAPHSSYFDALAVTYLNLTTIVAKNSAIQVPVFGTLTKYTEPILVDREDPNSRQNTIKEIKRRAESGGQWPQVAIFAEGTCTNRTCLISFKPGAFIPGVPVQPVCVKYPNKHDTTTWTWCGIPPLKTLYYTITQFNTRCEIEFLPVYVPSEEEKKDAMLFANNVRRVMARALGVPVTQHSYEDGAILCHVSDLGVPCAKHLVNVHLLVRLSGKTVERTFVDGLIASLHRSRSFNRNESEFVELLASCIPRETAALLFALYSEHVQEAKTETVDVRLVIYDLYLLTKPTSAVDILNVACQVYDCGNKGRLTSAELQDVLATVCDKSSIITSTLVGDNNKHFTYDDVRDLAASLSPQFAKAFTKRASAAAETLSTSNHVSSSAACGDGLHQARRAKAD